MARFRQNSLLEYLREVLGETDTDGLTDRELLERFAVRHDEAAFRVLVRRHGPTVLRVCQGQLERPEDAEDVFQAAFLVLARKAGSLHWRASIGAWLFEVAHRLAQEARRKQINRQMREAKARYRTVGDPLAEISGRELVTILDEEVANLPERYRAPLLLCCLEGKTDEEAAKQLGCSPSTLKRRLRRARELLHEHLCRRGFTLSVALYPLLFHKNPNVPHALVSATTRAAALFAVGGSPLAAGLTSTTSVALAVGMTHTLLLTKLKFAFVALLLASGLAAGTFALGRRYLAGDRGETKEAAFPLPAFAEHEQRMAESRKRIGENGGPVAATIETTLATAAGQIRQFAFDGDDATFFASVQKAGRGDHFTLVFDRPVAVASVTATTGRPGGGDRIDVGVLEVSEDGKTFEPLSFFVDDTAQAQPQGRRLRAVRIRPTVELRHPLAVREFTIESDPPVAIFKYPVEFVVDVADAPDMKPWADKVARVCERAYPMIHEELPGDGLKPNRMIRIALKKNYPYDSMIYTRDSGGGPILASLAYFQAHPEDVGAMIHKTVYVVQGYGARHEEPSWSVVEEIGDSLRSFKYYVRNRAHLDLDRVPSNGGIWAPVALLNRLTDGYDRECTRRLARNPQWLEAGIADYFRFFKCEPGQLGTLDPDIVRYNGGYRQTAAFLAYLTDHYDKQIVRKLNQIVRAGQYQEEVFETLTGKTAQELDQEWRAALRRRPAGR